MPTAFDANARILHPASDRSGIDVRWSMVAAYTGRRMHPLVQWHRLVGLPDDNPYGSGDWVGNPPEHGQLEGALLAALVSILEPHTTTPDANWFCLWDGYGWEAGSGLVITAVREDSND